MVVEQQAQRRINSNVGTILLPLGCEHDVTVDLIYRGDRSVVVIDHDGSRAECAPRLNAVEGIADWLEEQHG